jgi:hypothetical protein
MVGAEIHQLEYLLSYIANNNLGDDGLDVLCSGSWPKLAKLMLGNNIITTAGMDSFRKCTWTDLASLNLCTIPPYLRREQAKKQRS